MKKYVKKGYGNEMWGILILGLEMDVFVFNSNYKEVLVIIKKCGYNLNLKKGMQRVVIIVLFFKVFVIKFYINGLY